jgi:hypothetical protein
MDRWHIPLLVSSVFEPLKSPNLADEFKDSDGESANDDMRIKTAYSTAGARVKKRAPLLLLLRWCSSNFGAWLVAIQHWHSLVMALSLKKPTKKGMSLRLVLATVVTMRIAMGRHMS